MWIFLIHKEETRQDVKYRKVRKCHLFTNTVSDTAFMLGTLPQTASCYFHLCVITDISGNAFSTISQGFLGMLVTTDFFVCASTRTKFMFTQKNVQNQIGRWPRKCAWYIHALRSNILPILKFLTASLFRHHEVVQFVHKITNKKNKERPLLDLVLAC